jgi:arylsulfatase A-like enzyme
MKYPITGLLFLALAVVASPLTAAETAPVSRPNILFIAVDDLKPLTGSYGDVKVRTPAFDRLADTSTVFTRAYTQYPVCGPSRTSLLTGVRPESNGVLDLKTRMRDIDPDVVTLPQYFKNNGYVTAASGKIFDPRNVDSRDTDDPISWSIPYKQSLTRADKLGEVRYAVRSIDAPQDQFVDGDINARGIGLLRDMAADPRPFFLAVGYKKPHLPFAVPSPYFDLYDRASFPLEPFQQAPDDADASYILSDNNETRSYVPTPPPGQEPAPYPEVFTDDQQRELIHGYHAAVSFIDHLLGQLLAELDATGQADNTIIVLWGDHGFHLGDHGMWGKHTTMEQANRVPLMIRVPGQAGGATATLAELMDLYPTLAELAGLPVPGHMQGKSLVPVLQDATVDLGDVAISQYKRRGAYGYSMRTERYRYTEWVTPDGAVAYRDLYDMANDPGETRNIGALPENAELMESMAALLRANGAGLLRLQPDPPEVAERPRPRCCDKTPPCCNKSAKDCCGDLLAKKG